MNSGDRCGPAASIFDSADLPATYRCADEASKKAQRLHVACVAFNLQFLVLGATSSTLSAVAPSGVRLLEIAAAVCFLIATGVLALLSIKRWDRVWYAGRAVAETIKSLAWKYMAGADPFPIGKDDATTSLLDAIHAGAAEHKALQDLWSRLGSREVQITGRMLAIRNSSIEVRRDVYLEQRLQDQQDWYSTNAQKNRRASGIWLAILIAAHVVALAWSVGLLFSDHSVWRIGGIFAAMASGAIAWVQLKKYGELAQAYSYATKDLSFIAERARLGFIDSDEKLARFVNDAETAISREHTGWVARREI